MERSTSPLLEAFWDRVRSGSNKTAVSADGTLFTYHDLSVFAGCIAEELTARGFQSGDRVLLQLKSDATYIASFLGILSVNGVCVPISSREPPQLVAQLVRDFAIAFAICEDAETSQLSVEQISRACIEEAFADVRVHDAERWDAVSNSRPPRGKDAAIFFTSGSTGQPKAVRHSHEALLSASQRLDALEKTYFSKIDKNTFRRVALLAWRQRTRLRNLHRRQIWMSCLGFHTIGGHLVMMTSLLSSRLLVCAPSTTHPRLLLDTIQREGVTVVALTPALAGPLVRALELQPRSFPRLAVVGVGSAPSSPSLIRALRIAFGCAVVTGYGTTELGGGVLATRLEDADHIHEATVGRELPGVEVRIVDAEDRDVGAGVAGELICRTGGVMSGYADLESNFDADGWIRTGDIAIRAKNGSIELLGRLDDRVNRGGTKFYPEEVETVLSEISGIRRVCVVEVPVQRPIGCEVWAFVEGDDSLVPEMVRDVAQALLGPDRAPNRIIFGRLPVDPQGQIQRSALRDQALLGLI